MNRVIKATAASLLMLFGFNAAAQYPPRGYPGYYQRDEDRLRERNRRVLLRLKGDLESAAAATSPFTGDRWHIERARMEVNELQRKLSEGVFSVRDFDLAIGAVQRTLNRSRALPDTHRQLLANDLSRLRAIRERMGYERDR